MRQIWLGRGSGGVRAQRRSISAFFVDDRDHRDQFGVAEIEGVSLPRCATVGVSQGAAMTKHTVSAKARREFVARSTKASARLEHRVVPAGHVRSAKVESFVESLRSKH